MKNQPLLLAVIFLATLAGHSAVAYVQVELVGYWDGMESTQPDIIVSGGYAYVADGYGLQIIDVSNPAAPVRVGRCDTFGGWAEDVEVSGGYAYVADGDGLQIIDVFNPAAPIPIGHWEPTADTPPPPYPDNVLILSAFYTQVAVSGSYAYVGGECVYMYEVYEGYYYDPETGEPVYYDPETGWPPGSEPFVNYYYCSLGVFEVIDISAPAEPRRVGRVLIGYGWDVNSAAPAGIAISGNYAYVVSYDSYLHMHLQIIDVSNPAAPISVGECDTPGYACDVAVSGSYAYVANGFSGLQIIDVSNPAAPICVGGYDTPGYALDVAVSGSYAYVADWGAGVQIIDVSNPAAPVRGGGYDTPRSLSGNSIFG